MSIAYTVQSYYKVDFCNVIIKPHTDYLMIKVAVFIMYFFHILPVYNHKLFVPLIDFGLEI